MQWRPRALTVVSKKDEFNDRHVTTIQASFFTKRLTVGAARVKLAIWVRQRTQTTTCCLTDRVRRRQDTAGQERYAALGPIYYRDANGALLVYDITDRQSFDRVKQWVKVMRVCRAPLLRLCCCCVWVHVR